MPFRFLILVLFLSFEIYAQQDTVVDFVTIEATIEPISEVELISGTVNVRFEMLKAADSVFLDAKKIKITQTALESVIVRSDDDKVWLIGPFQPNQSYTAFFSYEVKPKQALYFTKNQIWTQGQGKYTSHWLPSLDSMTDKIEFDLTVIAPKDKRVIANGTLISIKEFQDKKRWKFDMDHPMSSYLVAFAIGDFEYKELETESGISLQFYFEPQDSLKVEPTYRYSRDILEFYESELNVVYPWKSYKQVPVRDFLYAGMENTTCTFFSTAFVVDSIGFVDRNYVNVNAHELAHQWFGNLITETNGEHHWLHEGFATYYALLAEKELFGEDYYYWKLYNTAEQLKNSSDQGKGERLLDTKASSLTYYEKGAWALHQLREAIGDMAFQQAIKNYLEEYAFRNVTTNDFINEVKKVTDYDVSEWQGKWLEQSAFPGEEAFESLMKSSFIQKYFELASLRGVVFPEKKASLLKAIKSGNDFIGQEAVYQLANEPFEEVLDLYKEVLESNNLIMRQAIALSLDPVPQSFQVYYESLLKDPSYLTQEAALYNLWVNFPTKRRDYLDQMNGVIGFQNRNIRQLWLTLALYTDDVLTSEKSRYSEELQQYTSPEYSFEIREKAFEFLYSMNLFTDVVLENLVNACTHHYWRFRDAARGVLDEYLKEDPHKDQLKSMMAKWGEKEKLYLQRKYHW